MYFNMKNYLKNTRNYTVKQGRRVLKTLRYWSFAPNDAC